jgi:hypothetical protein
MDRRTYLIRKQLIRLLFDRELKYTFYPEGDVALMIYLKVTKIDDDMSIHVFMNDLTLADKSFSLIDIGSINLGWLEHVQPLIHNTTYSYLGVKPKVFLSMDERLQKHSELYMLTLQGLSERDLSDAKQKYVGLTFPVPPDWLRDGGSFKPNETLKIIDIHTETSKYRKDLSFTTVRSTQPINTPPNFDYMSLLSEFQERYGIHISIAVQT